MRWRGSSMPRSAWRRRSRGSRSGFRSKDFGGRARAGEAQSFLSRRERLAPQAPAPGAERGSFLERRASASAHDKLIDSSGPFHERARDASRDHATLTPGSDDAQGHAGESASDAHAVRKADAMESAKTHMAESMSRLSAYLPEGSAKEGSSQNLFAIVL